MKTHQELRVQLRRAGHHNWFYARAEIQHLPHILFDDEVVHRVITGGCPDGIAIMVATNKRLLLIDKSPFTLNIEDFPYEHITNAEHRFGFIFGTFRVNTLSRELHFKRVNPRKIGNFAKFVHFKIQEASETVRRLTSDLDPHSIREHAYPRVERGSKRPDLFSQSSFES